MPCLQKNALYGIVMYLLLLPLQLRRSRLISAICWYSAIGIILLTMYLFAVLVYLRTVCLVCYGIYSVNTINLLVSYKRRALLAGISSGVKKRKTN